MLTLSLGRAAAALGLALGAGVLCVPAASAAPAGTGCPAGVDFRVGAAKADITPTSWPVAEAAYAIGRLGVGAAHPFWARAVAVQSCVDGHTAVFVALDSQGYFTSYKEDPVSLDPTTGYGTTAIRATVARDTGVPAANITVAATHTHNSPDSVGIWDGGSVAANQEPYLGRVKTQTVTAIETALNMLRPARLSVGTADIGRLEDTYAQVRGDPQDYPTDSTLRVLHAQDAGSCQAIATLVNAGVHADVGGPIGPDEAHDLIDPDWPGRVATNLETEQPGSTTVVLAGAVGRTGPSFPVGTDPGGADLTRIAAYGDLMTDRVHAALDTAAPVAAGPVAAIDTHLQEEIAEPALIPLFADETGVPGAIGGLMRSVLPPYTKATVLDAEVQTIRVASLVFDTVPGEPYPELATVPAARVHTQVPPFTLGLADDQLGYTPPAFEYPVVALEDGGDEGFFTLNAHEGDDIINTHLTNAATLGLPVDPGTYDGATAGPVQPPGQDNPAPDPQHPPYPASAVPAACGGGGGPAATMPEAPLPALLLVAGAGLGTAVLARRRRAVR